MQSFPTLYDNEVAIVRAEFSTGIVLDENFKQAIHEYQKVYTIFENLDAATSAAERMIQENTNIECTLLGRENSLIRYITPGGE
ncbi:MAG: hypothetical protein BGO55_30800 [Sphingobacteriales bacterium 50-39]|nr:hypothetical protein [Sphingobacteriales bacterium]OJW60907.1 MAG: hypothetical protein BGO55_30800 [Sphingobacteriales bacterium 50-39]